MKVIFLSDDDWHIQLAGIMFRFPTGVFELSVVHDARAILEDTDLEDLSTAIYLDMLHPQAEFVLEELHRTKITQKLIVVILCCRSQMNQDCLLGIHYGVQFRFRLVPEFLMKMRDERGFVSIRALPTRQRGIKGCYPSLRACGGSSFGRNSIRTRVILLTESEKGARAVGRLAKSSARKRRIWDSRRASCIAPLAPG
jgi:hypothetical protein